MIIGHRWWIVIWWIILLIGLVGFWPALYWGRETGWKNLEEVFRAIGTMIVSVGMLLFLYEVVTPVSQVLLIAALICFLLAFVVGRRAQAQRPPKAIDDDDLGAGGA